VNALKNWKNDVDITRATLKALYRLSFSDNVRADMGMEREGEGKE
jgi:hypothetical protein